jgi:hypothetical protein
MVWHGAPPTPHRAEALLRVVASCSVHLVSERLSERLSDTVTTQALQSALVGSTFAVRPCD